MVQIQGTKDISDDGKGQTAFKTFLRYLFSAMLLLGAFVGLDGSSILGGILYAVMAILYFLFVNNIAWNISNTVRKWVMPEAYFASDATDAFKKKIFWHVGPQWFGAMFAWLILAGLVELITPTLTKEDSKTLDPVLQSESKNNTTNSVPNIYQGEWYVENSEIKCDSGPMKVDSEKTMFGNSQSPLRKDGNGLINGDGDRLSINNDGTLTLVIKDQPEKQIVFKRCER